MATGRREQVDGATTPSGAVRAALATTPAEAPIVVDFDETLLLRNSTELYLASARPRLLAVLLAALVDLLRPWQRLRWGSSFEYRDWLRVLVTTLAMPWNVVLWRWRCRELAARHANRALIDALGAAPSARLIVASHGFRFIIAPLLRAMGVQATLVASPLSTGWRHRRRGKLATLEGIPEVGRLADATVVTDHADHDVDLIRNVARPVVVKWPDSRYEPAFATDYIPFAYTLRAKHPTRNHLMRSFIGKDWVVVALASAWVAAAPVATAASLLSLVLSFFVIYEVGYHENDCLGAKLETRPRLSVAKMTWAGRVKERQAWLVAALLAVPGAAGLAAVAATAWQPPIGVLALGPWLWIVWLAFLGLNRLTFWFYNRIDETTRSYIFLLLQLEKGFGVVVAMQLPITAVGAALLAAHALARWTPYVIYRVAGAHWMTPDEVIRLLLILVLIGVGMATGGAQDFMTWQSAAIVAWCLWKARRQLVRAFQAARWLPGSRFRGAPRD